MASKCVYSVLLASTLISGCSQITPNLGDLDRPKATEILSKKLQDTQPTPCPLNPMLATKPEFRELKNLSLCEVKVEITGIRIVDDTTRAFVATVSTVPQRDNLQDWSNAMDSLEQRLRALPGQRLGGIQQNTLYVDPEDGQRLIAQGTFQQYYTHLPVERSFEWRQLQEMRLWANKLLDNGARTSEIEGNFVLYDDGWRVKM